MNDVQTNIEIAKPETANSSGRYLQTMVRLHLGDCLDIMPMIPDQSIDAIITDPPYGTTACKWDSVIPLESMWEHLKRVIKPNGAIVLTASQPFTTTLISSNMKMFRYEWIWEKSIPTGVFSAKYMPTKKHENVLIFAKERTTYNPIMEKRENAHSTGKGGTREYNTEHHTKKIIQGSWDKYKDGRYPTSVKLFKSVPRHKSTHPTQKPVALMEYLIKTYTNEGETVLDFAAGSGTTGVACKNLNRKFIGIEKDEKYFEIAKKRIEAT